jgi:uncharacterized membrane protein YebE (DUF533 family)
VRCRTGYGGQPAFTPQQSRKFLSSLHAVAAADGEVSEQELQEIATIARELGFDVTSPDATASG